MTHSSTIAGSLVLVTGGSRGLGRSTALQLAARGADVVVTYRDDEASARTAVDEIQQHGRHAAALRLDVTSVASFPAFVESLREQLARWSRSSVDVLVHNAGTGGHAPIGDVSEQLFQAMFDVHLKGPFFLTQQLIPLIANGGRIVHVSTGLTRYTYPGQSSYAAMKGGFEIITRYLARELAARGITANSVAPGGILTDFGGGFLRDATLQAQVAAQTPLGRVARPDDVASVIATLAGRDFGWATGQRIEVTGGYAL